MAVENGRKEMNSELTVQEIKQQIYTQVTFDGRLLPDMAEAYKVKDLVDELLIRAKREEDNRLAKKGV